MNIPRDTLKGPYPDYVVDAHAAMAKTIADNGQVLAAGFELMRKVLIPPAASPSQVEAMRTAFMIGAQHVFAVMTASMDSGTEPTAADMRRMDLLAKEMAAFAQDFELRETAARGSA